MAETLHLTIRTPSKTAYDGPADSVHLRTEYGEMEAFPGHAPLMGTIGLSFTKVKHGSREDDFLLRQGFVFVDTELGEVRILAYAADKKAELDRKSAEEYMDAVLKALANEEDLNKYQLRFLEEQKLVIGEMLEETK